MRRRELHEGMNVEYRGKAARVVALRVPGRPNQVAVFFLIGKNTVPVPVAHLRKASKNG